MERQNYSRCVYRVYSFVKFSEKRYASIQTTVFLFYHLKIISKATGKTASGGRTYGRADEYQLNPGRYEVEMTAMKIDGSAATYRIDDVIVKANETVDVQHDFQSGTAMIGAQSGGQLVDAVVKITDPNTEKAVGGGRTYTSPSSNPKDFILTPGTYRVTLTALGDHQGKEESFTIEVKARATVEKNVEF